MSNNTLAGLVLAVALDLGNGGSTRKVNLSFDTSALDSASSTNPRTPKWRSSMSSKYDIFRKTPETPLTWIETVEDINDAEKRFISLASGMPGEYFVWDLWGHKFIEELEESAQR
jgi:hypothetical protein